MSPLQLPRVIVPPSVVLDVVTLFDDARCHWSGQFLQVIEDEEEDLLPAIEDSPSPLLIVTCDEQAVSPSMVPGLANPVAGLSMYEVQIMECRGAVLLPLSRDIWQDAPPSPSDIDRPIAISQRGKGKPRVVREPGEICRTVGIVGRFATVDGVGYVEITFTIGEDLTPPA